MLKVKFIELDNNRVLCLINRGSSPITGTTIGFYALFCNNQMEEAEEYLDRTQECGPNRVDISNVGIKWITMESFLCVRDKFGLTQRELKPRYYDKGYKKTPHSVSRRADGRIERLNRTTI